MSASGAAQWVVPRMKARVYGRQCRGIGRLTHGLLLMALLVAAGCRTRMLDESLGAMGADLASGDLASGDLAFNRCAAGRFWQWSMERGSPQHTAWSWQVGPASGAVRWEYDTGIARGAVDRATEPVLVSDTVLLGLLSGGNAELRALSVSSGTLQWKVPLQGRRIFTPAVGPVTSTIYVSDGEALHALDWSSGREIWRTAGWGPLTVSMGEEAVYMGNQAFEARSGRLLWTVEVDNGVVVPPAVGNDCTVYLAASSLYAVDPDRGAVKWKVPGSGSIQTPPAIADDGTVFFGLFDRSLYAVDGASGAIRWKAQNPGAIGTPVSVSRDGLVYFDRGTGDLVALDAATGQEKWAFHDGNGHTPPLSDGGGTVYFGSSGGTMFALDGQSGAVKWKEQLVPSFGVASSMAAIGRLYVVSERGGTMKLLAVSPN